MFLIPTDQLSRLLVVMAAAVVEMMNCFAVLDSSIRTFIQVALVIGPLSLVGVVLILRKIEKDHPERIRWK
jgi:multidrug efflux pump subunit AcrB